MNPIPEGIAGVDAWTIASAYLPSQPIHGSIDRRVCP